MHIEYSQPRKLLTNVAANTLKKKKLAIPLFIFFFLSPSVQCLTTYSGIHTSY